MYKVDNHNNILLIRGDSIPGISILVLKENGEEYVMQQGDELKFTMKKKTEDRAPVLQKTIENGQLFIDPEDTELLECGVYRYDVQLTYTRNGRRIVDTIIPPANFKLLEEVTW